MPETGSRTDPYGAFNFVVEIDGTTVAGFSEVSGLDVTTEPIEYREGTDKTATIRKIPGLIKYGNIILKRGYTENRELWDWVKATIDGQTERRSGAITLLDESREHVVRFSFEEGWPCRYAGPIFDAGTAAVAIEIIEICHEGLSVE